MIHIRLRRKRGHSTESTGGAVCFLDDLSASHDVGKAICTPQSHMQTLKHSRHMLKASTDCVLLHWVLYIYSSVPCCQRNSSQ